MGFLDLLRSALGGAGGIVGKEAREEETGSLVGTVTRVEMRGGRAVSYSVRKRDGDPVTYESEKAYQTPDGLVILPEWYVEGWNRVEQARSALGVEGTDVVGGRTPLGSPRAAGAVGAAREQREELSRLHFRYSVTAQKLRARAADLQAKRMLEEVSREELVKELESLQRRARLNKMMLERCQELIDALDGLMPGEGRGPGALEPESVADALSGREEEPSFERDDRSAPGRPLTPQVAGAGRYNLRSGAR
jgi:hypothetical protein